MKIDVTPIPNKTIAGSHSVDQGVPVMIEVKLVNAQEFGVAMAIFRIISGNKERGSIDPPSNANTWTPIVPTTSAIFSFDVNAATTIANPATEKI